MKIMSISDDLKQVKPLLDSLNWSFVQRSEATDTGIPTFDSRKYLPYPGTYIPEIPYALIDILSNDDAVVLDPFAGSGTTFFQALILGRKAIGVDVCVVSTEYIGSLYELFRADWEYNGLRNQLVSLLNKYDPSTTYKVETQNPFWDELSKWFTKSTLNQIVYITNSIINAAQPLTYLLRAGIIGVLKNVNSQDRGWGCIADNMKPKENQLSDKNVLKVLLQKCGGLIRDMHQIREVVLLQGHSLEYFKKSYIYHGDINKLRLQKDFVSLVVTSPPYPNMTDYITSQRLAYYWLGQDPDKEKFSELGARFKRNRNSSLKDYLHEISNAHNRIMDCVLQGGYICYVLPEFDENNDKNGQRKDVINTAVQYFGTNDSKLVAEYERIIPAMRRSHNQKWATLKKEKIYIYQKQ